MTCDYYQALDIVQDLQKSLASFETFKKEKKAIAASCQQMTALLQPPLDFSDETRPYRSAPFNYCYG